MSDKMNCQIIPAIMRYHEINVGFASLDEVRAGEMRNARTAMGTAASAQIAAILLRVYC